MTESRKPSSEQPRVRKGGKFIPALCRVLGTILLLAVVAVCLPLSLPRLFGYEVYNVLSGSMAPAIPAGSVVYVKNIAPENVVAGDVIAFRSDGAAVTHRVTENRFVEGEFVTKGDANETEDPGRVSYSDLIGIVGFHVPAVGRLMALYASRIGKLYLLLLAACGVMFHLLARRILAHREERYLLELARAEMLRAGEKSDGEGDPPTII